MKKIRSKLEYCFNIFLLFFTKESYFFAYYKTFVLGIADVDEKLHQLSKKYSSLMDKYRQLKGMKATPVRNQEVDSLLERIKEVYEETPDHRKPALPPELENK